MTDAHKAEIDQHYSQWQHSLQKLHRNAIIVVHHSLSSSNPLQSGLKGFGGGVEMTPYECAGHFKAYSEQMQHALLKWFGKTKKRESSFGLEMHRCASQSFAQALQQELNARHLLYKNKVLLSLAQKSIMFNLAGGTSRKET